MKKIGIDYYLLFMIVGIGLILRLYFILTKNIFHDELAYFNIARLTSIKDIMLINHWIKDHGIVYYLLLKPFIYLTNNLIYLRLINLFFYLLSSLVIFMVLKKRFHAFLGLLIVFLYSFHRYFIYLNAQISPFNLVLFFSILSILALYYLISNKDKKPSSPGLILFISSTILGFYSDYSFFYMGWFYLLVLIWVIITKQQNSFSLITPYLLVLVFIIPGIFQFISNFSQITFLFENTYQNQPPSFISFIKELASVLVLRASSTVSLIFLGCLIHLAIAVKKVSNLKNLLLLVTVLILSFLINTALLYIFSQHFFTLFIERSFWFFNISLIILVSIITYSLLPRNKLATIIIYSVFYLFGLINFIYPGNTVSDVSFEIKYNTFLEKLINEKQPIKTVLLVDRKYTYTVLSDYYFSKVYPKSDKYYAQIDFIRNNLVIIERYKSLQNTKIAENTFGYTLVVIFNPSYNDLETAKFLQKQNHKTLVYYSRKVNSYQWDFIAL